MLISFPTSKIPLESHRVVDPSHVECDQISIIHDALDGEDGSHQESFCAIMCEGNVERRAEF